MLFKLKKGNSCAKEKECEANYRPNLSVTIIECSKNKTYPAK